MCKITYIHHSGFFVELNSCCLLFDYWQGEIPPTPKKLYVFASHSHGDHYNPEIFKLRENYDVTYIMASEIRCKDKGSDIISIKPNTKINVDSVTVETLKSTDSGAAFIVCAEGKTIFHAGDLNLWLWKEETKQYNNNMKALFEKYISPIAGREFDIGFIPLDPRQEEYYSLGMDRFLETADFKAVFPMHFWGDFSLIEKYRAERPKYAQIIKTLTNKGQITVV